MKSVKINDSEPAINIRIIRAPDHNEIILDMDFILIKGNDLGMQVPW